MKILIPTDFSKFSRVAVFYAAKLAKKLDAEIILLNVVFIGGPGRSQTMIKTQEIIDYIKENSQRNFKKLLNEIRKEVGTKVKITSETIEGYPVEDVVEKFAVENKIDMIIIGTKGASGLKKVLIGSNAAAVISNSKIPVITVPEHARYNNIKHIVYASDMLALKREIKTLIAFAQLFNAAIHMVHIVSIDSKKNFDSKKIQKDLISKYGYRQIHFHISESDDVIEAIDDFLADSKADLLAMFTHKPTFFEKLFDTSITRKMAFHSWIPLLAIKKMV